jgi:hypothetical protein
MMLDDDDDSINLPRLVVSLRVVGDSLDPDFLTQQFGVAPSFSARKGEPARVAGGSDVRRSGVWSYRLELPPETELGEGIGMLLAVFPEDSILWEEITSAYTADVFCGAFLRDDNQSTVIEADVLAALGRRGLPLSLDLYSAYDGDEEPAF